MSGAAKSMVAFGMYLVLGGLGLTFFPKAIVNLAGMALTNETWIRVPGIIVGILGLYYVQAGRENNTAFFRMTLWGRALVFVGFVSLALFGGATPVIGLFGLVDVAAALWTFLALQEGKHGLRSVEDAKM